MKRISLLRCIALFAIAIFVSTVVSAAEKAESKIYTCVIDGIERTYKLYLPDNIQPNAPLVFVLHGYGGNFNHDDKGFNEAADRHGFAVCYPQGSKDGRKKNCWNVGYPFQADMKVDDISFMCKLAKKLQKEHNLSRKNTFCTGMSNGGEMCYLLAYDRQSTFKAVAPIAAEDEYRAILLPSLLFGRFHRQTFRSTAGMAKAKGSAGTPDAIRLPVGPANGGTQFHQCLRKRTRFSRVYRFQRRSHRLFLRWQIDGCGILRQP